MKAIKIKENQDEWFSGHIHHYFPLTSEDKTSYITGGCFHISKEISEIVEIFDVQITSCDTRSYWYYDQMGKKFKVVVCDKFIGIDKNFTVLDYHKETNICPAFYTESYKLILVKDCEVLNENESCEFDDELKISKEKVIEAAAKCPQAKETLKTLWPHVFKEKKVICISEDGEELFEGDKAYYVQMDHHPSLSESVIPYKPLFMSEYKIYRKYGEVPYLKIFKHKVNAEIWIAENEVRFSLNDVLKALDYDLKEYKEIVITRLNLIKPTRYMG